MFFEVDNADRPSIGVIRAMMIVEVEIINAINTRTGRVSIIDGKMSMQIEFPGLLHPNCNGGLDVLSMQICNAFEWVVYSLGNAGHYERN